MRLAAAALSFVVLAALWPAPPAAAEAAPKAADHLGMPGPITFGGEHYHLAWSSKPSATYAKHEYVTEFETVERYTRMIIVEQAAGVDQTKAALAKVAELDARKAQDPLVSHEISRAPATGDIILLFTLSAYRGGERIFESNAYRYVKAASGGVTLMAYSLRSYGENGRFDHLRTVRTRALKQLMTLPLPQGKLAN